MKFKALVVPLLALVLIAPLTARQTEPVKNPTKVTVASCIDHAQDTGHEIDIIEAGTVIATIDAGDPAANADGTVTFDINVQPIKFGSYTFVVRATAGAVKSENSPASDPWERVPGPPGKASAGK